MLAFLACGAERAEFERFFYERYYVSVKLQIVLCDKKTA